MHNANKPLLKHYVEYAIVRAFEFGFRITPYRLCILNACLLSRFAFHIARWRRAEAIRRIRQVFPDIGDKEANDIAYRSLRNIILNAAELMHLSGTNEKWIKRHVIGAEETMTSLKSAASESGAILALPHYGNWDLAGIVAAHYGVPIFAVAGSQHNRLTNDWINRKRGTGIAIVERGTVAIRQILKRLKSKEVFAILPDVRMKSPDLEIEFLGAKANLGRGMALFARKTGAPILLAHVKRENLYTHCFTIASPIRPDTAANDEDDIRRMTCEVMSAIEKQIKDDPGQWFWYNKRWVLDPLAPSSSK